MTNGIEVNQIVRVKASGQLGRVVAVDDHHDRLPADLQLEMPDNSLLKIRVDEVQTFEQFINDGKPINICPCGMGIDDDGDGNCAVCTSPAYRALVHPVPIGKLL